MLVRLAENRGFIVQCRKVDAADPQHWFVQIHAWGVWRNNHTELRVRADTPARAVRKALGALLVVYDDTEHWPIIGRPAEQAEVRP